MLWPLPAVSASCGLRACALCPRPSVFVLVSPVDNGFPSSSPLTISVLSTWCLSRLPLFGQCVLLLQVSTHRVGGLSEGLAISVPL